MKTKAITDLGQLLVEAEEAYLLAPTVNRIPGREFGERSRSNYCEEGETFVRGNTMRPKFLTRGVTQ